jgi:outer membrane protein OmpA-like peptidoglycan-associated protein
MNIKLNIQRALAITVSLAALALLTGVAAAQSSQLNGVINGRSGASMTVQTQDAGKVVVILTPSTQALEPEGVFRKKHLSMTALVPGLSVEVKGSYNAQNQLVADTVVFHGSDLKTAQDIQAGLAPTEEQVQQNQQQIAQNQQQIAQSQAEIQAQKQQIREQQQKLQTEQQVTAEHAAEIAASQAKIAANKAAIVAANKRFGELGEYNILGEVTVLFGNGQVAVDPQYDPQLLQLAQKATGITGYIIQVSGYASKVGSAALNQKLSTERAENVTTFLEQQAQIPLTNILAPGAMGTSQQVAPDSTAEGQAENRRVVVKILQNKGIAGQ